MTFFVSFCLSAVNTNFLTNHSFLSTEVKLTKQLETGKLLCPEDLSTHVKKVKVTALPLTAMKC